MVQVMMAILIMRMIKMIVRKQNHQAINQIHQIKKIRQQIVEIPQIKVIRPQVVEISRLHLHLHQVIQIMMIQITDQTMMV